MSRCALVITLCLALGGGACQLAGLFPGSVQAAEGTTEVIYGSEPTATASAGAKLDFDTVCGTIVDKKSCNSPSGTPTAETDIKFSNCQAACTALKTKTTQQTLGFVWGGVAGVCAAACVASLAAGATQELICAGVNVAGGITDAVISKEYAGIITSVLTAGGGLAINHTIGKSLFPGKKSEDGAGPENTGTDGTTPTTDGTPDAETTPDAAKAPKEDKPKDLAACVVYRPFNRPFPLRRPGSQGLSLEDMRNRARASA